MRKEGRGKDDRWGEGGQEQRPSRGFPPAGSRDEKYYGVQEAVCGTETADTEQSRMEVRIGVVEFVLELT